MSYQRWFVPGLVHNQFMTDTLQTQNIVDGIGFVYPAQTAPTQPREFPGEGSYDILLQTNMWPLKTAMDLEGSYTQLFIWLSFQVFSCPFQV